MRARSRILVAIACVACAASPASAAEMGKFPYEAFERSDDCAPCHAEIHEEWRQSLMSRSFTHEWDEVEYFQLALPHALKLEKVSEVKGGCIACHGPLAFLSGDIPPKPVREGTRANEGGSCEICHSITGSSEAVPYNFSYAIAPGSVKQGPRADAVPDGHEVRHSVFTTSPELCATCHDEQSPYGAWVKETYREWKAGPYAREGTRCQDCHMYDAPGRAAEGGPERKDVAHHVFHGSHFESKLAGALDLALYAPETALSPGKTLEVRAEIFNGKAGHFVPSGSSEERMLWLEVWAVDPAGKRHHLPVKPKGFRGEELTIAGSKAIAYRDFGEILGLEDFRGLRRDGNVPDGARIFRRPFFNPAGEMTVCQWYTAQNTTVDYRVGPRETKTERFAWTLPKDLAKGPLTVEAKLYYAQIPSAVGEFFKLEKREYAPLLVNGAELRFDVR